jgi:DNA-binding phage protein
MEYHANESPLLKDKKNVRDTLLECLMMNDLDSFQDVLIGYIRTTAKSEFARKTHIGRTTLYDLIDPDKPFNPTLETLGKIFEELAA